MVELIVVIVIIGIGTSIAVPNFARMIQRNEWRGFVQTAQNAESTLMALTGMQYANIGDPVPDSVSWPGPVDKSQYVSIDRSVAGTIVGNVFQVTVAWSGADQKSAGEQEFYKRTMISNISSPSWDGGPICAVYCNNSGLTGTGYIRYEFVYSVYYLTSGVRNITVYHNARPGQADAPGWHIYESNEYVGSL